MTRIQTAGQVLKGHVHLARQVIGVSIFVAGTAVGVVDLVRHVV